MAISVISTPQALEISVNGPGSANRLFILSGAVSISRLKGTGKEWVRNTLNIQINRPFLPGQYIKGIGTASLSAIYNQEAAVNAGWAIENVAIRYSSTTRKATLTAQVAVRDSDGFLSGIAYEVFVLATV